MNQKNKNCTNENTLLDIDVSDVFVVKNAKNRAFIEQFNYSSVNFTQRELGTILGFFAVRNENPNSENIVNYLASEVKRHYFAPIQKSAEDKFESTLHHINRVLEEIANVGNVEWLGYLDGVICVVNNNSIHMSVTGNAHILLLRDNILQNISEGLASKEASQYPLKTFGDIASGALCANDKIIITSQELLDLVPLRELEKNAIRFGQENFVQFVSTVLTNECSMASTIILDIKQDTLLAHPSIKPHDNIYDSTSIEIPDNIFGATAFENEAEKIPDDEDVDINEDLDINTDELLEEDVPEEYIDKKTGHIYIQGTKTFGDEDSKMLEFKEKYSEILESITDFTKKQKKILTKKIKKNNTTESLEIDSDNQNQILNTKTNTLKETTNSTTIDEVETFDDVADNETIEISQIQQADATEQTTIITIIQKCKGISLCTKNFSMQCINNTKRLLPSKKASNHSIQNTQDTQNSQQKSKKNLLPNFKYITHLWHNMTKKTRIITIAILTTIIIVPLIFALIPNNDTETDNWPEIPEETTSNTPSTQQSETLPAHEDISQKNTISDPTKLLENTNILDSTTLNNLNIGATSNTIFVFDKDTKKYDIPSNAGNISLITAMDDLDLLFILTTTNKLYTFSPVEKNFVEQKNIPTLDSTKIKALGTYMTYLYTLENEMITRYARKENGFDKGIKWLKDDFDLSNTTTFAIDEYIFVAIDGQIVKFTKGHKTSFTQDDSIKNADLIYTTQNTKSMWVLDTKNNKLFKTQKGTGKNIQEYSHNDFSNAKTLSINEKENIAIISTSDNILEFKLN
jgi:hypothetical protein